MAIEQLLLDKSSASVLAHTELDTGTLIELDTRGLVAPYDQYHAVKVDGPDAITEFCLDSLKRNGLRRTFTRENINRELICSVDQDGNYIFFRWRPSIYGEDGKKIVKSGGYLGILGYSPMNSIYHHTTLSKTE